MNQSENERLAAFENVLQSIQDNQRDIVKKMEELRSADKTKTATFRQLMGKKLTNDNILHLFKLYDIE